MRNCFTAEVDLHEVLLGRFGALADAFGFLAVTDANFTLLVDNEGSKAETTTTFNDLGATVDVDDLLGEFGASCSSSTWLKLLATTAIGTTLAGTGVVRILVLIAHMLSLELKPPSRAASANCLTQPW